MMRKKNVICAMLILIFTVGIAVGAWQIYQQLHEYSEGADSYTDLETYVQVPKEPEDDMEEMPVPSESGETENARWWPEVHFEALRKINPDLVGWIYIEGTEINYPVVQGADNQLKHLFTGEWNSSGCKKQRGFVRPEQYPVWSSHEGWIHVPRTDGVQKSGIL